MAHYHFHKPLSESIDISTLYSMRREGMTNKQIANSLGVAVSTIYKYIGKMSRDVQAAKEQNKPCPVPEKELCGYSEEQHVEEPKITDEPTIEEEPVSTLKIKKEVRILDLEGVLCEYHVNPLTGDVEFRNGAIQGMLDKLTLNTFISELTEILNMMEA